MIDIKTSLGIIIYILDICLKAEDDNRPTNILEIYETLSRAYDYKWFNVILVRDVILSLKDKYINMIELVPDDVALNLIFGLTHDGLDQLDRLIRILNDMS